MRATSVGSGTTPERTRRSSSTATAVSSPTMPKAARSNSPFLLGQRVGRVVGGDAVDGPVDEALEEGLDDRACVRSGGFIFTLGS